MSYQAFPTPSNVSRVQRQSSLASWNPKQGPQSPLPRLPTLKDGLHRSVRLRMIHTAGAFPSFNVFSGRWTRAQVHSTPLQCIKGPTVPIRTPPKHSPDIPKFPLNEKNRSPLSNESCDRISCEPAGGRLSQWIPSGSHLETILPPTCDTSPEVPVGEGELDVSLKDFVRKLLRFRSTSSTIPRQSLVITSEPRRVPEEQDNEALSADTPQSPGVFSTCHCKVFPATKSESVRLSPHHCNSPCLSPQRCLTYSPHPLPHNQLYFVSSRPDVLVSPPSPQLVPLVPSPPSAPGSLSSCPPNIFSRKRARTRVNPGSLRCSRGPARPAQVFSERPDIKQHSWFTNESHNETSRLDANASTSTCSCSVSGSLLRVLMSRRPLQTHSMRKMGSMTTSRTSFARSPRLGILDSTSLRTTKFHERPRVSC